MKKLTGKGEMFSTERVNVMNNKKMAILRLEIPRNRIETRTVNFVA